MNNIVVRLKYVVPLFFVISHFIGTDSKACENSWIYRQFESCPDSYNPVFKFGSSKAICGHIEGTEPYREFQSKTCRRKAHGIAYYVDLENKRVTVNSGGIRPEIHCQKYSEAFRNSFKIPQDYRWSLLGSKVAKRLRVDGVTLYHSTCEYRVAMPIYKLSRAKYCGPEAWKYRRVEKPKSCRAIQFGIELLPMKIGPHCPIETSYRVARALPMDLMEFQIRDVQCLTCDNISVDNKKQLNRRIFCLLKNLVKLKFSNGSLHHYVKIRQELRNLSEDYQEWILPRFKYLVAWNLLDSISDQK